MNTPIVARSMTQTVIQNDPYSRAIRLLRWVVAALGFLWCTRVPAQPPVWQPLWFAEFNTSFNRATIINLNNLKNLDRNPSAVRHDPQGSQRSSPKKPVSLSFFMTHPDAHVDMRLHSTFVTTSAGPNPGQFTSYETTPLYLQPFFVLTRLSKTQH
jgi:hypothetical protein